MATHSRSRERQARPLRVFLSHRSPDKDWAEKLGSRLRENGVNAWLDKWEIEPGDSIVDRIDSGLARSDCLLLVLTPDSVRSSARWVRKEWQAYLSGRLSRTGSKRLIPLLVRNTRMPAVLQDIKYIDFRNEADFDDRFVDLYKTLSKVPKGPAIKMLGVEDVKRNVALAKYHEATDAMSALEEAAARLAGRSRAVIPGKAKRYPRAESQGMFQQAFAKLQQLSRDRAWFSKAAFTELNRTVAMIETMNLDFMDPFVKRTDRAKLRKEHGQYLERSIVDRIAERNRELSRHMADEFDRLSAK